MKYVNEYPNGRMCVDTDRIAEKYLKGGHLFVRPLGTDGREKLVEYLVSEGFTCANEGSGTWQVVPDSAYPLVIDLDKKSVTCMESTTCAAAAASSGVVMGERDFYLLHSLYKLQSQR